MSDLSQFNQTSVNWRQQLKSNERRTYFVMVAFVLIYAMVGVLIDLFLHPELDLLSIGNRLYLFATFKVFPTATIIFGLVAFISIWITFALHDRIMLLGTEYHEITSSSARSLEEKQLYHVIEELKIAAGLRFMPRVFLIEADYMNAFASGYSEKSAMVAITRGLLQKLERSELQAVMAHELNHIRHHDIKLTLMASVLSNIILIALDVMFRGVLLGGRGRRENGKGGGGGIGAIIMLLRFLLPVITILLLLYLSRRREFMADAGAVELTRDNIPLAKALLKINDDHMSHKEKYAAAYSSTHHEDVRREAYIYDPAQAGISIQRSVSALFSTHPPIEERLKALGFEQKIKKPL